MMMQVMTIMLIVSVMMVCGVSVDENTDDRDRGESVHVGNDNDNQLRVVLAAMYALNDQCRNVYLTKALQSTFPGL